MIPSSFENWCSLPTSLGEFRMYDAGDDGVRLVCLGDIRALGSKPLLRVHSSCLASEVFGAMDCDCADQLSESMGMVMDAGLGLIVHLHQEGRGHGLSEKIRAVGSMQRGGLDTAQAFEALGLEQDTRTYEFVVELLQRLGIEHVRLITNNPTKTSYFRQHGILVEVVNTHTAVRRENVDYLRTKIQKLGHAMSLDVPSGDADEIRFYHSSRLHGEFSNFSAHPVYVRGKIWPTTEHYYQAQKFAGTEREELIRRCPSPTSAKRQAGLWVGERREDWALVKEGVMRDALRAKFTQHPQLRELLTDTRGRTLVEHTEQDAYWGDAGDGTGRNMLGVLLMRLRAELSDEQGRSSGRQ